MDYLSDNQGCVAPDYEAMYKDVVREVEAKNEALDVMRSERREMVLRIRELESFRAAVQLVFGGGRREY